VFSVFIPASPNRPETPPESRPKLNVPGGTETILLVEDEPVVRRLARNILERHGYRVFNAENGMEALSVWSQRGPESDLLLTDMVMPGGVTGRELARRLQAEDSMLKIIYTTGYSLDALNSNNQFDEGVNFIPKPYTPEQLALIVRRSLDEAGPQPKSINHG
jgi:CheY-like chemotaxis protein